MRTVKNALCDALSVWHTRMDPVLYRAQRARTVSRTPHSHAYHTFVFPTTLQLENQHQSLFAISLPSPQLPVRCYVVLHTSWPKIPTKMMQRVPVAVRTRVTSSSSKRTRKRTRTATWRSVSHDVHDHSARTGLARTTGGTCRKPSLTSPQRMERRDSRVLSRAGTPRHSSRLCHSIRHNRTPRYAG